MVAQFKNRGKAMLGIFKSKSEVEKLIERIGLEKASLYYAEVVANKLPNQRVLKQFLLEELDAASQGNTYAREYARQSPIPEREYRGALGRSFPEVDGPNGPQQTLLRIALQLSGKPDLMVRFRLMIVSNIAQHMRVGTPDAPADLSSMEGIINLIQEIGAPQAREVLRDAALNGNLLCQTFFVNLLIPALQNEPSDHVKQEFEFFAKLAAEQGDPEAQFNLALHYSRGVDVSDGYLYEDDRKLLEQARDLHMKAAAQGFAPSVEALKNLEVILS